MLKKAVFLTSILAVTQIFAADVLIKAGANKSWFATEGGTSEAKPAVGIGVQFPLNEAKNIKLGIDITFVDEIMILRDRSRPYSVFTVDNCEVYSSDLLLHYQYIHIPIYFNSVIFQHHNFMVALIGGLGIKLVTGNNSSAKNYNFDIETCEYDYERVWTDAPPFHPPEAIIGTEFSYKSYGVELIFHYTLSKTKSLYGLKIQDHIHSIRLMLFWRFH